MKEFEIWMEGYAATGESGTAQLIAKSLANTFDEAVEQYKELSKSTLLERNTRDRYISDEAFRNRKSNWNIWACNLFDNEADARKSFG